MRNSAGFLHGLGSVFGRLWGCFGTLDPWFLVFRVGEMLILKKALFSCLGWLFRDFGRFWGGLGGYFGSQRATKMASKFDQKNEWFLDRSWKRSGAPKGGITLPRGDSKSPRGGLPLIVGQTLPGRFWKSLSLGAPSLFHAFFGLAFKAFLALSWPHKMRPSKIIEKSLRNCIAFWIDFQ